MTVLITGATGRIGREVTRRVLEAGREVRVLTRRPHRTACLGDDNAALTIHEWHPITEPVPAEALDGVAAIINLMGESLSGRWTNEKRARLYASRVTSTRKLAEAAASRVRRLVNASSFGIYAGARGESYDETTPIGEPKGFLRTLVRDWEAATLGASEAGVGVALVRIGMVTGLDAWPRALVHTFLAGRGVGFGDGQQIVPVIALEDAARMLVWAAIEADVEGPVNCAAPYGVRLETVLKQIAEATGKPLRFRLPALAVRLLQGARAPLLLGSYDIRPELALTHGFTFRHPQGSEIVSRAVAAMLPREPSP